MNIDNINKVIAHLSKIAAIGNTQTFDMGTWYVGVVPEAFMDKEHYVDEESASMPEVTWAPVTLKTMEETGGFKCNTVACIAGHTALVAAAEGEEISSVPGDARDFLGLSFNEAYDLFTPDLPDTALSHIKIEDAIFALTSLRDHGYVDWPEEMVFNPTDEAHPNYDQEADD